MDYREAAVGAAEWLLVQGIDTDDGMGWPEAPGEEVDNALYGGAGVILTMLDAYAATNDQRFSDAAQRGADHLVANLGGADYAWSGFYVGIGGAGFVLDECGRHDAVATILEGVRTRGHATTYTDILFGAAGTVCWLVHIGEMELARERARWLVSVAEPAAGGLRWSYSTEKPDYMPNFSHGTSGIAYALTAAGLVDEAIEGANHLVAIAERPDGGFRVRHFDDGEPPDFPLGWCHGPTGTARLFQTLADTTGDATWTGLRDACANTVRTSGIPERRAPGFWDNVAACCGSTGVGRFFLGLHRRTGDADHLAFARTMADDIVGRATVDEHGVRWSNIEHRAPDPVLPPGIGYMQGAAGIASFLFELGRFLGGDGSYRRWPDDPF